MATLASQNTSNWVRQQLNPILDALYTAWDRDTRLYFQFNNVPPFSIGSGTEYHVAKTGNDTTGDGSLGNPWLTIDYGLSQLLVAGSTLSVGAGTYTETGSYIIQDSYYASLKFYASGTLEEPITLRAKVGDEGLVIIDGGLTLAGLLIPFVHFVQVYGIRVLNCALGGIVSYDPQEKDIALVPNTPRGVRIENNYVGDVIAIPGWNRACLRMFGLIDSYIINNKLVATTPACNGFQSYSASNVLIENNYIDVPENGVYFKDHFVTTNPRLVTIEAEVRYNRIKAKGPALQLGVQAKGSQEAGYTWFHHNITSGADGGSEYSAIFGNISDAAGQSTRLRVEHNIAYMPTATTAYFIESNANDNIQSFGNIAIGMKQVYNLIKLNNSWLAIRLIKSDYNIYNHVGSFAAIDRYNAKSQNYATLVEFQAALAKNSIGLMFDNPDANSVLSDAVTLFNDAALDDFTHKAGSPAIGFMPDGSNAGAYQYGTETIGLLPTYSAGA